MRKHFRSTLGIAAAAWLSTALVVPASAQRAERELLGIRIWNSYADVLTRHGQPTRFENGLVTSAGEGQTVSGGAAGSPGMPGMGGMPGMPGMGGGMPGSGGGGGGKMGAMMGMPGMPGMPGMGGGGGMRRMGSGGGGGMPGMPSMPGGGGMPGMGAMPGMPGMGGGGGFASTPGNTSDEARSTWVYQRGPITNYFVFNKDGRVVQIESSGLKGTGGVTARGIGLGTPVARVYRAYGWTAKVTKNGPATMLDYSRESHAAFVVQDVPGRGPVVVDIMVTLLDVGPPSPLGSGAAMAGGPAAGGMGGMMGMPGGPMGMMGSGGGKMGAMMGMPGMPGRPGAQGIGADK